MFYVFKLSFVFVFKFLLDVLKNITVFHVKRALFSFNLHGCFMNSFLCQSISSYFKTFSNTLVLFHCRKWLERVFFVFYFFVFVLVVALLKWERWFLYTNGFYISMGYIYLYLYLSISIYLYLYLCQYLYIYISSYIYIAVQLMRFKSD